MQPQPAPPVAVITHDAAVPPAPTEPTEIWINGHLVCDYEDAKLSRRGVVGLQVHSGGPTEVRYKEIKLEVLKKE